MNILLSIICACLVVLVFHGVRIINKLKKIEQTSIDIYTELLERTVKLSTHLDDIEVKSQRIINSIGSYADFSSARNDFNLSLGDSNLYSISGFIHNNIDLLNSKIKLTKPIKKITICSLGKEHEVIEHVEAELKDVIADIYQKLNEEPKNGGKKRSK